MEPDPSVPIFRQPEFLDHEIRRIFAIDDIPDVTEAVMLLPNVAAILRPLGASTVLFGLFRWGWQTVAPGPNWRKGELYYGRGQTYHDASREALRGFAEMVYYRRTQGDISDQAESVAE